MPRLLRNGRIQAVLFHVLRVTVIWSLLSAAFFTILRWVYYINLAQGQMMGVQALTAHEYYGENLEGLATAIPQVGDDLAREAVMWLVVAAVGTVLLLLLPRVRRYHKSLIITSATVAAFCVVMTGLCDPVINAYTTKLAQTHQLYGDK